MWRYLVIAMAVVLPGAAAAPAAQERPLRQLRVPTLVTAVAFSPDGETLTAWDPAGFSRWNAETGRLTGREPVLARVCDGTAVLPRSSNGRVVAANCRSRLFFFNAATAAPIGERPIPEKETAAAYTASADGKTIAIVLAGQIDTVQLTSAGGTPDTEIRVQGEIEQLTFPAAGTRLAVGTWRGVEVREVPGGALLRTIEGRASHAISDDGQRIAVLGEKGPRIVEAASGELARELEGRVAHVRFGAGAARLVGWTNQRVIVWDVATGAQRLVLTGDEFVDAAIAPDGTRLVTVSLDRRGERTTSIVAVWRLP